MNTKHPIGFETIYYTSNVFDVYARVPLYNNINEFSSLEPRVRRTAEKTKLRKFITNYTFFCTRTEHFYDALTHVVTRQITQMKDENSNVNYRID